MQMLPGHNDRVRGLCFSPDGLALASGGSDWIVRLWDLDAGREQRVFHGNRRNVLAVIYGLDARVIASAGGDGIRVWDVATGAVRTHFTPLSGDDRTWFSALLGSAPKQAPEDRLRAAEAAGWRLSRTRSQILTAERAIARRADLASPFHRRRADEAALEEVTVVDAGRRRLKLVIPASGLGVRRGTFAPGCDFGLGHSDEIETAFSPDGRTLAVIEGRSVWLSSPAGQAILGAHDDVAWSLAFAPDGRMLATGGHDGTVRLWDVEAGVERAVFNWEIGIIDSVAFSPDGMRLAAGGKRGIVVWDVEA